MSSSSCDDDDDDECFEARKRQAVVLVGQWYTESFCIKQPCRTCTLQGLPWVQELLYGNPARIYQNLRMSASIFIRLKEQLLSSGLIAPSRNMNVEEMLAIFLFTVSQSSKNRNAQERFQRSGETISRKVLYHCKTQS